MRLIGGVPTEEELQGVVATFGEEGKVSFAEFLDIVEKHRSRHGFMADELRFEYNLFNYLANGHMIQIWINTRG